MPDRDKILIVHAYRYIKVGEHIVAGPQASVFLPAVVKHIRLEPNGYDRIILPGGRDDKSVPEPLGVVMADALRKWQVQAELLPIAPVFPEYLMPCDSADEAASVEHYLKTIVDARPTEIHSIFLQPWGFRIKNIYRELGLHCDHFIPVPVNLPSDMRRDVFFAGVLSWFDPLGTGRYTGKPFRENRQARLQPGDRGKPWIP